MAKKREAPAELSKPPESPKFSVHFHAEADSPEELHRKMGKAFHGKGSGEGKKGHRGRGGRRGARSMKREMKKREAKR